MARKVVGKNQRMAEMKPIDTLKDCFLRFLAEGMSYAEALDEFDRSEINAAINAELERGDSVQVRNPETMMLQNACGHETLFDLVVKAEFQKRNERDFNEQAVPLMLAGWTMENPSPSNSKDFWRQTQTMSLYWRAPSKRPGKPGRKYLSTNQAFRALQKSQQIK